VKAAQNARPTATPPPFYQEGRILFLPESFDLVFEPEEAKSAAQRATAGAKSITVRPRPLSSCAMRRPRRLATSELVAPLRAGEARQVPPIWRFLRKLGPGLITGAADDDPSGIGTYSQAGAQFGYGMLWTMIFSFPLMAAIQEISARIGRVSGRGIAGNMRRHYALPILYAMVILLLGANTFNIGADIGAMGAAAALIVHGPQSILVILAGVISLLLQVFIPYSKYVNYLKWLTMALFAYIATAIYLHEPRWEAIQASFFPALRFTKAYLTLLVAILGTTISPYLFFWQSSEEVEEVTINAGQKPLKEAVRTAPAQLDRIRIDTYFGMAFSNIVAFFVILTTAAALHAHGIQDIETADQAARALEPLAGRFASLLFACGIVGTGLLAVPVLAGSASYAVSETLGWTASLEKTPRRAMGFYMTITVATVAGILLNFLHTNPIKMLLWSAVLNGVVAGPLMMFIMLLARNPGVMGKFTLPPSLQFLGWAATAAMILSSLGMVVALALGKLSGGQ
jgi:NRAMP (natural resistance-associated macrophage protein)-like metal ion transporter